MIRMSPQKQLLCHQKLNSLMVRAWTLIGHLIISVMALRWDLPILGHVHCPPFPLLRKNTQEKHIELP
jgi:hypothetical protein